MPIIDSTILDFALLQAGTVESLFDLALLNGVGITDDIMPGTVMAVPVKEYDLQPVTIEPRQLEFGVKQLKLRQTVIDFTCQHAGTVESLFVVAQLNGVSITENVPKGSLLKVSPVKVKNVRFYLDRSGLDIITDQDGVTPGGIGYMQIGTSFKVS
jgi:hypothetical protein